MEAGFSRISVEGYRRLRSVDVRLRPINVLIGANGVGKTSFLEVFRLMARAIDRKLQSSISELGGMASLLTADGKTGHLALRFETRPEPGGSEEWLWDRGTTIGLGYLHRTKGRCLVDRRKEVFLVQDCHRLREVHRGLQARGLGS